MTDQKFDELRDKFREMALKIMAAQDHVQNVERKIRVINKRVRAIVSTLSFQHLLAHVLIELISF